MWPGGRARPAGPASPAGHRPPYGPPGPRAARADRRPTRPTERVPWPPPRPIHQLLGETGECGHPMPGSTREFGEFRHRCDRRRPAGAARDDLPDAQRGTARVDDGRGRALRPHGRGTPVRARTPARRRRAHAARQPAGVGAHDGRLLPPGLRRAPMHRAAAGEGPAAAPRRRPARARGRRRAQRGRAALVRLGRSDLVGPLGRAARARRAAARRPRPRGSVPDHVHVGHGGRAEGGPARPALPGGAARAGRALARRAARRAGLVHGGLGLVEVGPQRVHRAVDPRRRRPAARRPFRPARAARAARARARGRPLHGADRVPRHRQAGGATAPPEPQRARRGRRGAGPRRARHLARRDRPVDPRRLRADRDRPTDRDATRRPGAAGLDGARAPGRPARRRRRGARARSGHRPDVLRSLPRGASVRAARGGRAIACTPTRTASSTSRAAPTT